jgi:hypothetical protein
MTRNLFLIALLLPLAIACAGTRGGQPPAAVTQPVEKNSEFLEKLQERMHEEEGAFKTLSEKMDEYLNLMATCDSLADTEDNRAIKASCNEKLRALKVQLRDLSDFLRDEPDKAP